MWSESDYRVLRTFEGKGGRVTVSLHTRDNPPTGGFNWETKERVEAEGQLSLALVLTHDCEIENEDRRSHRLVALVRPLEVLNDNDQAVVVEGRHFGRLYLPSWSDAGLPESYADLRRITTLREDALTEERRLASMTDFGREVVQDALIRYLTEKLRRADD
jgi:hypothetical protein